MKNPVEAAVAPLKADALARAEQEALAMVARVLAALEAAEMDVNKAFPRGRACYDGRNEYLLKNAKHNVACSMTKPGEVSYKLNAPHTRVRSAEAEAKFVANAKADAALQYDAFVAKLVAKVGEVASAELAGNHVWGHSVLTVAKADGSVEKWKTQQIVNVSKLGLLFNQWPTRKVK